jgi:hypothetical protein
VIYNTSTDFDPHSDTPVEILHVILLGVVKYFWRDTVLQFKSEDDKKRLIAKLNSFEVSGLGIPRLAGHTLVTYAGSLTGRDFRAIAQAAPFALQGFKNISPQYLQLWASLGELVSLVWTPEIEEIDGYIVSLSSFITNLQTGLILSSTISQKLSIIFSTVHAASLTAGLTSRSFIFLFTYLIIFGASDQLFSSQPKASNHTMPSFALTACIVTDTPLHTILHGPWLLAIASVTCSVEVFSWSKIPRSTKHQPAQPQNKQAYHG